MSINPLCPSSSPPLPYLPSQQFHSSKYQELWHTGIILTPGPDNHPSGELFFHSHIWAVGWQITLKEGNTVECNFRKFTMLSRAAFLAQGWCREAGNTWPLVPASLASCWNHHGSYKMPGAVLCYKHHPSRNICSLDEDSIISTVKILLPVLKAKTLHARPSLDNILEVWF